MATILRRREALATPSGSKKDLEDESPETVPRYGLDSISLGLGSGLLLQSEERFHYSWV